MRRSLLGGWESPVLGLLILGGLIYWGGLYFSLWFETHPLIAGVTLIVAVVGAWSWGGQRGRRALRQADKTQRQANAAHYRAEIDKREAKAERDRAEQASQVAKNEKDAATFKFMREDSTLVEKLNGLPLRSRIGLAITLGHYPGEEWSSFTARRQRVIERRVEGWENARRHEHRLLPIVEAQMGLCGDPSKDSSSKGCGCYLYVLPPAAVHIDHVVPRSRGGSNDLSNLQALCSSCNIRAGARFEDDVLKPDLFGD